MAESFKPLTTGVHDSGATAFRPKVVSALSQAQGTPFAPLHSTSPASARPNACSQSQPVVTPKREGDRITGVRVQCGCGQVIDLAFTF